jgi:hypothetical protein
MDLPEKLVSTRVALLKDSLRNNQEIPQNLILTTNKPQQKDSNPLLIASLGKLLLNHVPQK